MYEIILMIATVAHKEEHYQYLAENWYEIEGLMPTDVDQAYDDFIYEYDNTLEMIEENDDYDQFQDELYNDVNERQMEANSISV